MSKKFLYLDIDGILNNTQVMLNNYGEGGYKKYQEMVKEQSSKTMALEQHTLDHIIELDWKLCLALQHLLDKYDITDVIICSTWRKVYDRDQLKLLFLAKGFPEIADKITDITSRSYDDERLVEIQKDAQLRVKKYDVIFILDDAIMCEFKSTFAFKDVKIDQYNLLSKFERFKLVIKYGLREINEDVYQMMGEYEDENVSETLKKYRKLTKEVQMETCWICRKKTECVANYGRDQFPVCGDCADENPSIAQCCGYDGYDCQAPVLGEEADDEFPLCQECREHYWEQDPDYEEDFSKSDD